MRRGLIVVSSLLALLFGSGVHSTRGMDGLVAFLLGESNAGSSAPTPPPPPNNLDNGPEINPEG